MVSARSSSDLWASLEACAVENHGLHRLDSLHGRKLPPDAHARFCAFVHQARQYFETIAELDPVAKPLTAYYFALNLTKAFLTVADPSSTQSDFLRHGLNQDFKRGQRYSFKRERFKVDQAGVFRLLAENSGMGHCWAKGHSIGVHEVLKYLPDGYDLYADAEGRSPSLLPIHSADVYFAGQGKKAWLRVEIDRDVLRQRNLSPERVLTSARIFGSAFRLVTTDLPTASYESTAEWAYGKRKDDVLRHVGEAFDALIIGKERSFPGGRQYITLSDRTQLLSHEAVTFGLLHHLSNVVRYRPMDAERLRGTKYFWILASWIDRASESFLLAMASRITREEHVLA
ncbi:MAG: hypothetical protein RL238_2846 [Actinomycetota bacterium]|jgi:hypothetical protein